MLNVNVYNIYYSQILELGLGCNSASALCTLILILFRHSALYYTSCFWIMNGGIVELVVEKIFVGEALILPGLSSIFIFCISAPKADKSRNVTLLHFPLLSLSAKLVAVVSRMH